MKKFTLKRRKAKDALEYLEALSEIKTKEIDKSIKKIEEITKQRKDRTYKPRFLENLFAQKGVK